MHANIHFTIFGQNIMKKTILTLCTFVLLATFACTEKCDEPDIDYINGLHFELLKHGDSGFSSGALDSIYFVRYIPFSEPLIADTAYPQGYYPDGGTRFTLNDKYPFYNDQSPYFTIYGYMVIDPTTGFVANITDIKLEGEYDGDCGYINTFKSFVLNNDTIEASGADGFVLITK